MVRCATTGCVVKQLRWIISGVFEFLGQAVVGKDEADTWGYMLPLLGNWRFCGFRCLKVFANVLIMVDELTG